jgi:mRNA-degrading endonuclease RelE of RelBE toxin-antitoxin system
LVWARPALRDMKKLDQQLAKRIREALVRLAETGHGDVVKLTDVDPPEWRIRVGDHRAFFRYEAQQQEIHLLRVRRRDEAY